MKETGMSIEEIEAQTSNDFYLINTLQNYMFTKPECVTADEFDNKISVLFEKLYICGEAECFDKKMKRRVNAKLYCLIYKDKSSEKLIALSLKPDEEPLYIFEKLIKRRKSENKAYPDRFDFFLDKTKERLIV